MIGVLEGGVSLPHAAIRHAAVLHAAMTYMTVAVMACGGETSSFDPGERPLPSLWDDGLATP
jgi:hypothetical protein